MFNNNLLLNIQLLINVLSPYQQDYRFSLTLKKLLATNLQNLTAFELESYYRQLSTYPHLFGINLQFLPKLRDILKLSNEIFAEPYYTWVGNFPMEVLENEYQRLKWLKDQRDKSKWKIDSTDRTVELKNAQEKIISEGIQFKLTPDMFSKINAIHAIVFLFGRRYSELDYNGHKGGVYFYHMTISKFYISPNQIKLQYFFNGICRDNSKFSSPEYEVFIENKITSLSYYFKNLEKRRIMQIVDGGKFNIVQNLPASYSAFPKPNIRVTLPDDRWFIPPLPTLPLDKE